MKTAKVSFQFFSSLNCVTFCLYESQPGQWAERESGGLPLIVAPAPVRVENRMSEREGLQKKR